MYWRIRLESPIADLSSCLLGNESCRLGLVRLRKGVRTEKHAGTACIGGDRADFVVVCRGEIRGISLFVEIDEGGYSLRQQPSTSEE